MTPKQKAEELVEKFKPHSHFWVYDFGRKKDYDIEQLENAVECALIAVDEIINSLENYGKESDELQNMENDFSYWQDVKQELLNMK